MNLTPFEVFAIIVLLVLIYLAWVTIFGFWIIQSDDRVISKDGKSAVMDLNTVFVSLVDSAGSRYHILIVHNNGRDETIVESFHDHFQKPADGSDFWAGTGIIHSRKIPGKDKYLITWENMTVS